MNHSTEKMLMDEIPRIREMLELYGKLAAKEGVLPASGSVVTVKELLERELKPGVTLTKNNRYMLNGKFIKKEDAYE